MHILTETHAKTYTTLTISVNASNIVRGQGHCTPTKLHNMQWRTWSQLVVLLSLCLEKLWEDTSELLLFLLKLYLKPLCIYNAL